MNELIADEVFSILKKGIGQIASALGSCVPWSEYNEIYNNLETIQIKHSNEVGICMGKVQTLLLDFKLYHTRVLTSVYNLCSYIENILSVYTHIGDADQAKILAVCLQESMDTLTMSNRTLAKCGELLNEAVGELYAMKSHLIADLKTTQEKFDKDISRMHRNVLVKAASTCLFKGIVGVISLAVGVVALKAKFVPDLEIYYGQISQAYAESLGNIENQLHSLSLAKNELSREIDAIEQLKTKALILKTKASVGLVNELIELCTDFQKKYKSLPP